MRLHSNTITPEHIANAAQRAHVTVPVLRKHGSKKRARAFEIQLSGNGITGGQFGSLDYRSATWDEWGIFLAALYTQDPNMVAGTAYLNREHFEWSTANRYDALAPESQCKRHKWENAGTSIGGAYSVAECARCGAYRRWVASGHTWAEIAEWENA